MWLSKMLRRGEHSECKLNGVDILHIEIGHGKKCMLATTKDLYLDFFVIAVSILTGQLTLMCIIEKIGHKIPISEY